ncbi:hypothetical protein SADUNF_Sadunf01G0176400 [Salix dunnii]|uniref:Uncharacterized protein n=1 Tax=Salix dunnii TaxID=1413687 RepID=A0A835NCX8_9ROSI|nr:hypothetical protein SADUNF_Sadunf01G0176400 [Salix dunnii]
MNSAVISKGKNVLTNSKCTARVHSKYRDMMNYNVEALYTAANQSDHSAAADGAEGKEKEEEDPQSYT